MGICPIKYSINRVWIVFALAIWCFTLPPAAAEGELTVYIIEQLTSTPNQMTVRVNRPTSHSATHLILRGVSFGVAGQVKDVTCNDRIIKEDQPGRWTIPKECYDLRWQVLLPETEDILASIQQSVRSKDFILISEASSIPRLENAAHEILKISIAGTRTIYPTSEQIEGIPLPNKYAAPLFILLNATNMGILSEGSISLSYFLDNPENSSALPSMISHIKGLQWLDTIITNNTIKNFTIGWLGIAGKKMNLAGATGENILLVNYPNDNNQSSFGKIVLLYIALHEAFHQLTPHAHPAWVSESLASYCGTRAIQTALPKNAEISKLIKRFQEDGNHFQDGLVIINDEVEQGNRSQYGAFYTKGLAFWIEVNKALEQQGDKVDHYIPAILRANGNPINLQKIFNLPSKTWVSLQKRFLD